MGIWLLTIDGYATIIVDITVCKERTEMIDEKTKAEIARDIKIYDSCKLSEVYGVGCERMVMGIVIEAMLSAGYRKGSIVQ